MKKKILIVTASILFIGIMFSNTGYAKAIKKKIEVTFGAYIIQLNGKNQSTETLYYNSKVYIPIKDVTKLTGAAVKTNKNIYNITPVKKEDGIDKEDINKIKFYGEMQHLYRALDSIGDGFFSLSSTMDIAYDEIDRTGKTDYLNNTVLARLNRNIEYYNDYIGIVEIKLARAKTLKLFKQSDQDNLYEILNFLSNSIDSYKLAYDDLNNLAVSNSDYGFGKYHANATNAYEKAIKAQESANKGYNNYYDAIQNFK